MDLETLELASLMKSHRDGPGDDRDEVIFLIVGSM